MTSAKQWLIRFLDSRGVEPHSGGFRLGVDPGKLNQLVDELEVEDFADEAGPSRID